MQLKSIATWGVFIVAIVITLIDNLPSARNLARLEFLADPAYFIYRTMSLDGLVFIFGLTFLLSSRIPLDRKTGVMSLMLASPVKKSQYVFGKLIGGFLYTFVMLSLFLSLNTMIYFTLAFSEISAISCLMPLVKTLAVSALPVSIFVGFVSVAMPAVMDVRLFYLITAVLFIVNAASVRSAEQMPFYLITSGDLMKLVWQHPKWPFINAGSIQANLVFLIGCGLMSWMLLLLKRKFWRVET
jgi:hypothetical protein